MKNKEKIHLNEIIEGKGTIEVKTYIAKDNVYNSMAITKDQIATHADCERCKQEFEKRYTYQRYCDPCKNIIDNEKYMSLEPIEWDGITPLAIYNDDTYFFNGDDILSYCEDNEINVEDLKLVLCLKSTFTPVDIDQFTDDVHEDWEPSDEMVKMIKDFNTFLESEPTNTWFPTNKRVSLKKEEL